MNSDTTTFIDKRPVLAERFTVIDTLGDGASSAVYLVADAKRGGEHVALKVLQNNQAFDEHTLKRFTSELEVCREIQHKNIVQSYDLIELGDTVAFTMEYVRGADLLDIFRQPERLSYGEIDRMFIEILHALGELHKRDIVHRDLKLENVLIREDGVVKLSDLGLMKRLDREGLTKPGLLLGTVHYMPPEYITNGKYDARGDIYGVAIMLLEMLTKKRRLASLDGRAVIQELLRTRFQLPEALIVDLPKKYQHILKKGAAVDVESRYQSVEEMLADFKRDSGEFLHGPQLELTSTLDCGAAAKKWEVSEVLVRRKKRNRLLARIAIGVLILSVGTVIALILFAK